MFESLNLRLPNHLWPFWIVALLLPSGFAGMAFVYYPILLQSGTLDPNADSIGIPIFETLAAVVVFTPIVLVVTAACLWKYRGGASLLIWDLERPYRSIIVTFLFGIPAVFSVMLLIYDVIQFMPWYEYLWELNALNLVAWLLMMRGALLAKRANK
jgi:heme/copper-type cytochrome/quinol oxidase subunit 2